jgi:hypothetical protein
VHEKSSSLSQKPSFFCHGKPGGKFVVCCTEIKSTFCLCHLMTGKFCKAFVFSLDIYGCGFWEKVGSAKQQLVVHKQICPITS